MDAIGHTPTAANSAQPGGAKSAAISSDFETFLVMLTTQMQNQDPLNPMESSDFAVQLATFSGVEQQVQTNDLLADLGNQFGVMNLGQLAAWVGMEARSTAPASFSGAPIDLFPTVPPAADRAELVVSNSSGTIVQRLDFNPTEEVIQWAGVASDGAAFPHGTYSFAVQPFTGNVPLSMDVVETFSKITEVQSQTGQGVLILDGGVVQPADAISALREPTT